MKISGKQLRKIIKEELGAGAQNAGAGLPNANDISRKLSSAGPEEAMDWLARVLRNMNFGAAADPVPPTPDAETDTSPVPDEEV